jgi:Arc/MetJ-type ribon-helix-helix transcriptional regulator
VKYTPIKDPIPTANLQVKVRKDLLEWIAAEVKTCHFWSKTHAVNYALAQLREREQKTSP